MDYQSFIEIFPVEDPVIKALLTISARQNLPSYG